MINSQEDLQLLLNQEKLMIVQSDKTDNDTKTEDNSKQGTI